MIGEMLQNMFTEVVGNDPENRRIAALPFKAGKLTAGFNLPAIGAAAAATASYSFEPAGP